MLWILVSLSEEARHGYALLKDVERLSEGRVRLSTGTLYGAIRRLVEDDWIEAVASSDTIRDKQTYRLTRAGRTGLKQEVSRLAHVTRMAATRLGVKAL